ncbi:MAG TPA: hypothetical protein ENJ56_07970 [Anaerolineae bacterium]|nr:hypothetical protein [Anaerolineae bacterium]
MSESEKAGNRLLSCIGLIVMILLIWIASVLFTGSIVTGSKVFSSDFFVDAGLEFVGVIFCVFFGWLCHQDKKE